MPVMWSDNTGCLRVYMLSPLSSDRILETARTRGNEVIMEVKKGSAKLGLQDAAPPAFQSGAPRYKKQPIIVVVIHMIKGS